MPTLAGTIERIVFRSAETQYTVARLRPNDSGRLFRSDLVTLVGALPGVNVGEIVEVTGDWGMHPQHGRHLRVTTFTPHTPVTAVGLKKYLGSGVIKGVGPKTAERIVDYFGEQTLAVLELEPERLTEVKGVGRDLRKRIIKGWAEQQDIRDVMLFLQSHGVSPTLASKIYRQYGKQSIPVIRENPYTLEKDVYGVGFKTADTLAEKLGTPRDSVGRLAAGIKYVLSEAASADGHCYLAREELLTRAAALLEVTPELLEPALSELRKEKEVFVEEIGSAVGGMPLSGEISPRAQTGETGLAPTAPNAARPESARVTGRPPGAPTAPFVARSESAQADVVAAGHLGANAFAGPAAGETSLAPTLGLASTVAEAAASSASHAAVYLAPFFYAEAGTARRLRLLLGAPSPLPSVSGTEWRATFHAIEAEQGIHLAAQQKSAVRLAYNSKISVLTGGPGVGKTTALRSLLEVLDARGVDYALAAPTGRAAKRMTEATGRPASTLHRLLEYVPANNEWGRDEERPLPQSFVIVDEVSMLDILLAYRLVRAVSPQAHLLFVGDADQLPSVGPGSVLRDILESERVPSTQLSELFRQSRESAIVVTAHGVNQGVMPPLKVDPASDFFFLHQEEPLAAQRAVVDLVARRLPARYGFDPVRDIQVLTPMYRGPVGVHALNAALQERLNGRPGPTLAFGEEHSFKSGDKVMQVRNNYDRGAGGVFNGDLGRVVDVLEEDRQLLVRFSGTTDTLDAEPVVYEQHELDELTLAYACSIHRAQGSEYPCVVIPLVMQHYLLLQRNLLYTAITRARRLCVVVGDRRALKRAVENDALKLRNTGLAERLRGLSLGSGGRLG
ncbi:MAG TPA: AAA family ATPase [Ktedonobacterales bacterium]